MKLKFIELKKPLFGRYSGMVIIPFVFLYTKNKSKARIAKLKNHEMIHVAQVEEEIDGCSKYFGKFLGTIFGWVYWYSKYIGFYLKNILGGYFSSKIGMSSRQAYMNIPYEKEAYANDDNLDYLKTREKHAWKKYK